MQRGITSPVALINNQTVAATATVTGSWVPVGSGFAFGVWLAASSALGTSQLTLVLHASPYDANVLNATTASAAQYISQTLVTDTASAENALIAYDPNTAMKYPVCAVRALLTGGAANPADTLATVLLTKYGL